MAFNAAIFTGMGEAAREKQDRDRVQRTNLLSNLTNLYTKLESDPQWASDAQQQLIHRAMMDINFADPGDRKSSSKVITKWSNLFKVGALPDTPAQPLLGGGGGAAPTGTVEPRFERGGGAQPQSEEQRTAYLAALERKPPEGGAVPIPTPQYDPILPLPEAEVRRRDLEQARFDAQVAGISEEDAVRRQTAYYRELFPDMDQAQIASMVSGMSLSGSGSLANIGGTTPGSLLINYSSIDSLGNPIDPNRQYRITRDSEGNPAMIIPATQDWVQTEWFRDPDSSTGWTQVSTTAEGYTRTLSDIVPPATLAGTTSTANRFNAVPQPDGTTQYIEVREQTTTRPNIPNLYAPSAPRPEVQEDGSSVDGDVSPTVIPTPTSTTGTQFVQPAISDQEYLDRGGYAEMEAEVDNYLQYGVDQPEVVMRPFPQVNPRAQIIGEGIRVGGTPPSAAANQNAESAKSGLRAISTLRQEIEDRGQFVLFLASRDFLPLAGIFKEARKEAADVITRLRTGAALNEFEVGYYQSLLPQWSDWLMEGQSMSVVNYKLDVLERLFDGLQRQGRNPIRIFPLSEEDGGGPDEPNRIWYLQPDGSYEEGEIYEPSMF